MEENSDSQMETDVSSTTQDIPLPEEVSGPSGSMEVTVEIAETTAEEEELVSEEQDERIDSNTPEKTPAPVSMEQKLSPKVIVIKKHKSPVKAGDPEKSLLKKDLLQSPSKMSMLKPAQASIGVRQALDTAKKSPEKLGAVTKIPEKIMPVVLVKSKNDKTFIVQKSPAKDHRSLIKDIHSPKIPEQTSPATAQKSPTKQAESSTKKDMQTTKHAESPTKKDLPTKHAELPTKQPDSPVKPIEKSVIVEKTATEDMQSPIRAESPEKVQDKEPSQNPSKKDVPLQPLVENPTVKLDKKAEILNKEDLTLTVSADPHDEKEISDDSQTESLSSASNKSISRELKSLINSAKESKIISECTQVKTKTRKSRSLLDTSNISLNTSTDPEKIQSNRRESCNSQESSSSEKSEKVPQQRILKLRSQSKTPSKAQKQAQDSQVKTDDKPAGNEKPDLTSVTVSLKVKSAGEDEQTGNKLRSDPYCWRCHYGVELAPNEKAHTPARCTVCPRAFHYKCLTVPERTKLDKEKSWVCPKCMTILHAESSETRSPVMKKITLGMLCDLLKHALKRMTEVSGVEPFLSPVDRAAFPDYDKYVVHAVDLGLMKESINAGVYGSTEAFASDAQWILHNSIIFNTPQSKLTAAAKALVRACRAEMSEIEACPECYGALRAGRYTWFTDVCSSPHVLLWAKLKGFPYWPAKGMSVNSSGMVDARFFGAHDRAWVPARDCFLYSEKDPNAFRTKRQDIVESMQEAEQHIRNISRKFGKFVYPAFKVPFEPSKLNEQIKMMIPSYEPDGASPKQKAAGTPSPSPGPKGRTLAKSDPKNPSADDLGDIEVPPAEKKRKKDSFVEIEVPALTEAVDKAGSKILEAVQQTAVKETNKTNLRAKSVEPKKVEEKEKSKEGTRKRRRSVWEEATMTIMTPEPAKRQKTAKSDTPDKTKPKVAEDKEGNKVKEAAEAVKTYSKTGTSSPKPVPVEASTENKESDSTPVRSTRKSTPSLSEQANKQTPVVNTPKEADKVKKAKAAQREKSTSSEKEKEKEDKPKPKRDRTPKGNKSQNSTPKSAKKKSDRENSSSNNESDSSKDRHTSTSNQNPKAKSTKDPVVFDEENTTLAVLSKKNIVPVLPTISDVRSLSSKTEPSKKTPITEASSNSSIFTPTSTDNVNTMKDAVAKLQKLRENEQPMVGRVGVRSFARMTSPPAEKDAADNDQVEVEVKAEPMDVEDAERQSEKINFANTIRLRPVNPQTVPSLRDIRITKVSTAGPTTSTASVPARKQIVIKPKEVRPKARKTFPQPQKTNDGRSELNSKNSMVYIPIQPPVSQAPVTVRPPVRIFPSVSGPNTTPMLRPQLAVASTSSNNVVNTMTTPLVVTMSNASSMPTLTQVPSVGQLGTLAPLSSIGQVVPQVGQVPTTVHTVPLITSVNGQWTFSLQPMMSVGGVDRPSTPPLSNGVPEPAMTSPQAQVLNVTPQSSTSSKNSEGTPGELPRLQQKPPMSHPLAASAAAGEVPTPSSAGPLSAKLNQNAAKLMDFFRTLLEDSIDHLDYPAAMVTSLKKEIERMQWMYRQQLDELKHNHELQLAEMRSTFEKEKLRVVSDTRRSMQVEINNAVKHTKSRQWCAQCQQEAQFYCCWNTSYCGYACQREHWSQHYNVCTQQRSQDNGNGNRDSLDRTEDRLQPSDKPPALQKPSVGAAVTVGGKLIQSRLVCQNSSNQTGKTSIIVSMVEDGNGYKPAPTTTQAPSLLRNKQLMNEDSTGKKVVTSGGYLIVGAGNTTTPSVVIN